MMLFVALILLIAMFAVQRAIPIVAASAVAWAVWHATHDGMATGLSGLAMLILAAGLIDGATNASFPTVRLIARGIDCCAGIAAAVFLAWSFARAIGGEGQPLLRMTIICISAGVLGLAFTFGRYRLRA